MQNKPTYYVDPSYSSSEITTISVPGSGSMGGSCSSGCSAPASSTSISASSSAKSASDAACSYRRNARLAYT